MKETVSIFAHCLLYGLFLFSDLIHQSLPFVFGFLLLTKIIKQVPVRTVEVAHAHEDVSYMRPPLRLEGLREEGVCMVHAFQLCCQSGNIAFGRLKHRHLGNPQQKTQRLSLKFELNAAYGGADQRTHGRRVLGRGMSPTVALLGAPAGLVGTSFQADRDAPRPRRKKRFINVFGTPASAPAGLTGTSVPMGSAQRASDGKEQVIICSLHVLWSAKLPVLARLLVGCN